MARTALLILFFLVACGGDEVTPAHPDPSTTPDADLGPDAAPLPESVDWQPCPTITDGTGAAAGCAEVPLPADWDDEGGARITVFVKRVGAADAPNHLWMLNGGPGASGADFEPLAEYFVSLDSSLAVYLLDHRGTGRSTRLGCAIQEGDDSPGGLTILEEEWEACLAAIAGDFGDVLPGFTTTDAARDLGFLIDKTRAVGGDVHVWGGSYGTRWAQRYLQLFPDRADAVTLLGIASPTTSFATYDERYDQVGRQFLARCGQDTFCASKLGADPVALTADLWQRLGQGHCPKAAAAGLDRAALRQFFATLLLWSWEERALITATLYRLDRCNAEDIAALEYLGLVLAQPYVPDVYDRLHSRVLGNHVGLSELWPDLPPSLAELEAIVEGAFFSLEVGPRFRLRHDDWPRYPVDQYAGELAASDVPMLMLEGELDPATTLADALSVGEHFDGANQTFVSIPDGSHSWSSPMADGSSCQMSMFWGFLADPTQPLLDCVGDILPMDFRGTSDLAAYFNTSDLYENVRTAANPAKPDGLTELRRRMWRAFGR